MTVLDRLIYRRGVGRWFLAPAVRWGLRRFARTGVTPASAYSAMRKLYGNVDASLFEKVAQPGHEAPTVDTTEDPAGLVHGVARATLDALRRDGYAVLPVRLDPKECAELVDLARATPCVVVDDQLVGGAPVLEVFNPAAPRGVRYEVPEQDLALSPAAQRIVADESLLTVAQQYLGAPPVQDLVTMWWTAALDRPASDAAAQRFHFDLDRLRFLKVFVYLTDVDEASGPHVYVRGSHRRKPSRLRRDGRHDDASVAEAFPGSEVRILGPAGTVFLADTLGLHKGEPVTTGHRLVFQTEYAVSLFGAPYGRPVVSDLTPELQAAMERHPRSFGRFRSTASGWWPGDLERCQVSER